MADLERIKREISILELARDLNFTPVKIGRSYSLKEHDSVRISEKDNLFMQFSTGNSGSNIDFLITFANMSSREAIVYLDNKLDKSIGRDRINKTEYKSNSEKIKEKKDLHLPKRANTVKNIYAYLLNTRKIDKGIVDEFLQSKMLYQDERNNCVFVSYKEDKPVFASLRGTNTYKKFIGDISGSSYENCFFVSNNKNSLVVTESPIDMMSVMSISKMKGKEYKNFDYLALSGTEKVETALNYHLDNNNYEKVILCMDNDNAGEIASTKAKDLISLRGEDIKVIDYKPLYVKDMNEYLIKLQDKNSLEHISMLYEKEFSFMTKIDLKAETENLYNCYKNDLEKGIIKEDTSFYDYGVFHIEKEKEFFDELKEYEALENSINENEIISTIDKNIELDLDDELEI